ncbi:uncharacterized protein SCHCODRAFT_02686761 [Schizophyllum commune H4-8]|uniref:Prolyl 4-hydroxylase alpha subunit Fe(2+) 2OG dioxygenase domain-containing protein n=1 Tax=Schizophyllum commune (strain H4-8 / FGSC 9210) TaxID=578458 RepID=D8Q1C4_SCHCM|nr:uncharacterized protein SCHCODRAFT_02686761 [Schizophyllum commune H4-8]KAI5895360.1 hypothetical protein SCHCODRAFT_02686761 [Schizophyllum commune H4-8]
MTTAADATADPKAGSLSVKDRIAAFGTIFESESPFLSIVCSIKKSGYLLYYGGERSPSCIDLANASEAGLQALADACRPVTTVTGRKHVKDERYRLPREMDPCDIGTQLDLEDLRLSEHLTADLLSNGSEVKPRFICRLDKLNVYGKGSCYKARKNTSRKETMVGSLLVVFPTPHEGGTIVLRDKGEEWPLNSTPKISGNGKPHICFVVFPSCVEHEITKVTSGHLVTLTYELYLDTKSTVPSLKLSRQLDPPDDSALSKVGQELKSMLVDFLGRPEFLPSGGFIGFGLRFMYGLDSNTSMTRLAGNLKGYDATIKQACDELNLGNKLFVHYAASAGTGHTKQRLFVTRRAFLEAQDDREYSKEGVDNYKFFAEKGSPILRHAGTKTIQDSNGDEVKTYEVHWLTPISTAFNIVRTTYKLTGKEARLGYTHGTPILLTYISSYDIRRKSAKKAGTKSGTQRAPVVEAHDPRKSSYPRDDAEGSEPETQQGKQQGRQRSPEASGRKASAPAPTQTTNQAPAEIVPSEAKVGDDIPQICTRSTREAPEDAPDATPHKPVAVADKAQASATDEVPQAPTSLTAAPVEAASDRRSKSSNPAKNDAVVSESRHTIASRSSTKPSLAVVPPSQSKGSGKRKAEAPAQTTRSSKRLKGKQQ